MTQAAFDTLSNLASALARFCAEGRSGTIHIVTNANHTAFFGLSAGQIVAVRYRIRKGARALEQMLGVQAGSYTFTENAEVESEDELPSTASILAMLGANNPELTSARVDRPSRSAATIPGGEQLPEATKATLLDILARYAGPVASLLGHSVFASTADLNEAIELLAQKIPDSPETRAFIAEARSHFNL